MKTKQANCTMAIVAAEWETICDAKNMIATRNTYLHVSCLREVRNTPTYPKPYKCTFGEKESPFLGTHSFALENLNAPRNPGRIIFPLNRT